MHSLFCRNVVFAIRGYIIKKTPPCYSPVRLSQSFLGEIGQNRPGTGRSLRYTRSTWPTRGWDKDTAPAAWFRVLASVCGPRDAATTKKSAVLIRFGRDSPPRGPRCHNGDS